MVPVSSELMTSILGSLLDRVICACLNCSCLDAVFQRTKEKRDRCSLVMSKEVLSSSVMICNYCLFLIEVLKLRRACTEKGNVCIDLG